MSADADEIIAKLQLKPHPEGGFYRETWRDHGHEDYRGSGTAIYFLLKEDERSHWHRVDAVEIWHHYAGVPLELGISEDGRSIQTCLLGPEFTREQMPQIIVPARAWQSARSLGGWALVGCTVSPAFQFEGFEMAPDGWVPGRDL